MMAMLRPELMLCAAVVACRFDPDDCLKADDEKRDPTKCGSVASSDETSGVTSGTAGTPTTPTTPTTTSSEECLRQWTWDGNDVILPGQERCLPIPVAEVCGTPYDLRVVVEMQQYWVGGLKLTLRPDDAGDIVLLDSPKSGPEPLPSNVVFEHPLTFVFKSDVIASDLLAMCWSDDSDELCDEAYAEPGCGWNSKCEFKLPGVSDLSFVKVGTWQLCIAVHVDADDWGAQVRRAEIEVDYE